MLQRLTCPIGLAGVGAKEPAMIAISVAAQLVELATPHSDLVAGQAPVTEVGGR
jgi:xanthine dehydrogenase accessory factor